MGPEQLQVVHRLQQHVGELGVGDPVLEPVAHHVARQHPVDREVLADVAQEGQHRHRPGPVEVVDQPGRVVPLQVDEPRHLGADPLDPTGHHLRAVQDPLPRLLGVADHPRRPAHEQQRPVPGALEDPRHHQLDEVAEVQARRRRVEADVERHRPGVEVRGERLLVGRVGEQSPPLQLVQHVGHGRQPYASRVRREPPRFRGLHGGRCCGHRLRAPPPPAARARRSWPRDPATAARPSRRSRGPRASARPASASCVPPRRARPSARTARGCRPARRPRPR